MSDLLLTHITAPRFFTVSGKSWQGVWCGWQGAYLDQHWVGAELSAFTRPQVPNPACTLPPTLTCL